MPEMNTHLFALCTFKRTNFPMSMRARTKRGKLRLLPGTQFLRLGVNILLVLIILDSSKRKVAVLKWCICGCVLLILEATLLKDGYQWT